MSASVLFTEYGANVRELSVDEEVYRLLDAMDADAIDAPHCAWFKVPHCAWSALDGTDAVPFVDAIPAVENPLEAADAAKFDKNVLELTEPH